MLNSLFKLSSSNAKSRFSTLYNYTNSQVTILDNGLRVATQYVPGNSSTVAIHCDVGSRFETSSEAGVSNLISNLTFEGTTNKPGKAFKNAAKSLGAVLKNNVSREHSTYSATVPTSNLNGAVELLSDAILNASMENEAITAAKAQIVKKVQKQDFKNLIMDNLHNCAFANTPLGRPVVGSEVSLDGLSREQILSFKAQHYNPNRMVVSASGNIDHKAFVEAVSKSLSFKPENKTFVLEPAQFTGCDIKMRYDDWNKCYIALAFPTAGYNDASNASLKVATQLLGNWNSSQPIQFSSQSVIDSVIDPEGSQATILQGFHQQYNDTGLFGMYAENKDPYAVLALCNNMTDSIARLSYQIDPIKLAEAKTHLLRDLNSGLHCTESVANSIAKDLLVYGRVIHPAELEARIKEVDGGGIKTVAKKFLNDTDHALAAIGSIYEMQDYGWWRRRSYWLKY